MGRSIILGYGLPVAGLAALVAGAVTVMGDQPQNPVETPSVTPPISPAAAGLSEAAEFIGATGVVEAAGRNILIASQVAGVIASVAVEPAQPVAAGDVLFVVDSRAAAALVALRSAEVLSAQARVEELLATIPPARARLDAARAQVLAASAATDRARGDLASAQVTLADRQNLLQMAESAAAADARAVSMEVLETRRFAALGAQSAVAAADAWVQQNQASIAQAEAGVAEAAASLAQLVDPDTGADGPIILAARAAVEQARAAHAAAQTELDLHTVRSPVDGMVLQVLARPGQFAPASQATDPLMVVGVVDPLHVRAQIDEVDVPRFTRGARAWASPRGSADARFELALVNIEPLVVPKRQLTGGTNERVDTRVLEVVYALPVSAAGVYAGQQLDVFIEAVPRTVPGPAATSAGDAESPR